MLASPTDFAPLTDIVTYLGQFGSWFWTTFQNFVQVITGNPVLLWLIIASLTFTAISLVIRIVKKFGLRGRRG